MCQFQNERLPLYGECRLPNDFGTTLGPPSRFHHHFIVAVEASNVVKAVGTRPSIGLLAPGFMNQVRAPVRSSL